MIKLEMQAGDHYQKDVRRLPGRNNCADTILWSCDKAGSSNSQTCPGFKEKPKWIKRFFTVLT